MNRPFRKIKEVETPEPSSDPHVVSYVSEWTGMKLFRMGNGSWTSKIENAIVYTENEAKNTSEFLRVNHQFKSCSYEKLKNGRTN